MATSDVLHWERNRRPANERSRERASHHRQAWLEDEDDFLDSEWVQRSPEDREENIIAEVLGRTIEACRMRAHVLRERREAAVRRERNAEAPYIGALDEPEDRWW